MATRKPEQSMGQDKLRLAGCCCCCCCCCCSVSLRQPPQAAPCLCLAVHIVQSKVTASNRLTAAPQPGMAWSHTNNMAIATLSRADLMCSTRRAEMLCGRITRRGILKVRGSKRQDGCTILKQTMTGCSCLQDKSVCECGGLGPRRSVSGYRRLAFTQALTNSCWSKLIVATIRF